MSKSLGNCAILFTLISRDQVGIGNHEAWYNWTAVTSRFHMPSGSTDGSASPFWYSFEHGLAHWVMLCSEFPLDAGSPQGAWLARDLAAAATGASRAARPWIVVTLHRPPYSSDASWANIRAELEPLLEASRVDIVLNGHMHAYERTHAVGMNGTKVVVPDRKASKAAGADVYANPGLPIYLTQGNAGAAQEERWERPAPPWSAVRWANGKDSSPPRSDPLGAPEVPTPLHSDVSSGPAEVGRPTYPFNYTDSFGFGILRFVNATACEYESVTITGSLHDHFWIVRPVPGAA